MKLLGMAGLTLLACTALIGNVYAGETKHETPKEENKCIGGGPQAPRDIDNKVGTNPANLEIAPEIKDMNLCNIHFHWNAEHKAAAYSTFVEAGDHSGWACQEPAACRLENKHAEYNGCQGIAGGIPLRCIGSIQPVIQFQKV